MITKADLTALRDAQLAHVVKLIASEHYKTSDDGTDYLTAALGLAEKLVWDEYNTDDAQAALPLFDPSDASFVYNEHACDGVCDAIETWLNTNQPGWETIWENR